MSDNPTDATQEVQEPPGDAAPVSVELPLPKVTTAAEWRRKATTRWLVTLPSSGATVKAKRPDFGRLVADNVITPEQLVNLPMGNPAANYATLVPLAKAVVPHIVLEPVVLSAPNGHAPDDAICVDEIPHTDLVMLFLWAGGWSEISAIEAPE